MTETQLINYSIGAIAIFSCLIAAFWLKRHERRVSKLGRRVALHALRAALLCAAILTTEQYLKGLIQQYQLGNTVQQGVALCALLAMTIVVMWQLFLLIDMLEKYQLRRSQDQTSARALARLLKVALCIALVLLFGEHFGMSVSGLLAFGGIGGIAIGMAGKDILSNFFSGIMLYYDREFAIGDWISSPDRNIEGTVVEIGWRLTKVMTFDHRPMYIPNALFTSITVQNPGRMTNRRINTQIGLRYEDAGQVGAIVDAIRTMLRGNEEIDQTQTLLVYFDDFGASSLNVMVYCFTKTTNWEAWLHTQQEVYLKIVEIVHAHGADFAFSTQTVYLESEKLATAPADKGAP
ncbi:mechanosensitive ion channel family protein [Bordetella tumulicola]|uniref:mechanosensitive ion channel family protein n=1 Tax=Bordetella tumulicola TaxID=1649133 RepID=UPI0039EFC192